MNPIIFADNQYSWRWARIINKYNFLGFVVQKDYIISGMILMHHYLGRKGRRKQLKFKVVL